ncbi:peptidyl-prolyl cis-trans isomerase FKBP53 [Typha angustifolia]|uniref:peptidyl-prolyl cis-trans isomerase FKBP53 n=1 Tax=Typha angustifolia TaxID=59011 RepID=UPI003C2CEADC
MAFWGIEVRPGKPYTHHYDNARGRLRVCQATLGNGKATTKSSVQCNVGNKAPILLCSLIPNVAETCHLEIEFEEEEEVIFSVLGQRSAHLSGYYIRSSVNNGGDETDSYGEDIAETDSEASDYGSFDSEDEYESDFIDDGDIEMFSDSRRKSGVVIEEIVEDDKPANGDASRRRLKKKHQVSDSDDGDDGSQRQLVAKPAVSELLESEDEDGFPLSFTLTKKNTGDNAKRDVIPNDKTSNEDRKRKIDSIIQNPEYARDTSPANVSSNDVGNKGVLKKNKKATIDGRVTGKENQNGDSQGDADANTETKDVAVSVNDAKPKNKRKEKAKKAKTTETENDDLADAIDGKAKSDQSEVATVDSKGQDCSAKPEELLNDKDQSSRKLKKKNKKKVVKDDIALEGDGLSVDTAVKVTGESNQQSEINMVVKDNADPAGQEVLKKKKKKSKNHDKDVNNKLEPANLTEAEDRKQPLKARTHGNGLIIEDLQMGKPDGKRASPGSKVFVNYIGKLQNGKIFDSNVGQRPFKFRLGIGEVIKGWDVGVNGMRVGDKRRLTIPPAMGYGDKAIGKIPKSSWLVFDVELVNVQ